MKWLKEMFKTNKPVIGMVHLHAMPTDPKYDPKEGIEGVLQAARKDVEALQKGGIDGILFCNEFSIPYTRNIAGVTIATFARIVAELKNEIKVPFGITCASSTKSTYDIAVAVQADFVRTHIHGAFVGVYGISDCDPGELERYRYAIGGGYLKVLTAIIPEGARALADRPLKEVVKTLAFNIEPDGLLIYSTTPGTAVDIKQIEEVKEECSLPVLASNGVKLETIEEILALTDGCIVGTGIKVDGQFYQPVDPSRVKHLMMLAKKARQNED